MQYIFFFAISTVILQHYTVYYKKDKKLYKKAEKDFPDDYTYLLTKGWGYYKQGNYQEALEILQKSRDLRIKNAIYNPKAYLHLDAAKKAVAGPKNNWNKQI